VTERRRDPYAILGVPRGAPRLEIGRAYRELAKRAHPDAGGDVPGAMSELNWAWHLLSDPRRRREWDQGHPAASSASHWTGDGTTRTRPDIEAGSEGWSAQSAWTASGEPWAGPGAPPTSRRAGFGCIGLGLLVVAILAFVLLAALFGDLRRPFFDPADAQQSEAPL
jgi:curved DNA-binding protein CbpA